MQDSQQAVMQLATRLAVDIGPSVHKTMLENVDTFRGSKDITGDLFSFDAKAKYTEAHPELILMVKAWYGYPSIYNADNASPLAVQGSMYRPPPSNRLL